ncbi:hypothetical protein B0H65DRAFT_87090 [Neurospora tetraspora]|uniref:EKC/KEOPS complex subunit BUD32 n=1 Tax=Neurospora tetraspora TaxID=94610 RepID=A0AAE0JIR7_9PEZI|nr:hypothetical protein B0H65DRAFT_87090 [Neurospora tetraspora]
MVKFNGGTDKDRKRLFIECLGWWTEGKYLNIAMEYLPLGDLRHYLEKNGPLKGNDFKRVIFQVLLGLGFMHEQEYTHRDIAPKNIFIRSCPQPNKPDERLSVVLADFGFSKSVRIKQDVASGVRTTWAYGAPEIQGSQDFWPPQLQEPKNFLTIDMWSLGVTMFELLTRKLPFGDNGADGRDFVKMWDEEEHRWIDPIPKRKWKKVRNDHLPWFVAREVSTTAQKFLYGLWTEFDKRPTPSTAMKHEWFYNKAEFNFPSTYLPGGYQQSDIPDYNDNYTSAYRPGGLARRPINGEDSASHFSGLRRIPGDTQRFGRASIASSVASPAELPDAYVKLEVASPAPPLVASSKASSRSEAESSYHTLVASETSVPGQTARSAARSVPQVVPQNAPRPEPQSVSRNSDVAKPGQDALHICPYTKLYGGERSPFENDKDLTCDENVTFLRKSDLLRHMSEIHAPSSMAVKPIPDYAFTVANTTGGEQQAAVQKLWWNAVYDQQIILMKYLLDKLKFDINMLIYFTSPRGKLKGMALGVTALYYAAFHGNNDMVKFLLSQKADTRPQDGLNLTPELIAVRQRHESTAQLIAEAEAKRKSENRNEAERIKADDRRRQAAGLPTKESVLQEVRQVLHQRLPSSSISPGRNDLGDAKRKDLVTVYQREALNRGIQAQGLKRAPDSDLSDERPPSRPRSSHYDPATTQDLLPDGRPPTPSPAFNMHMTAQLQSQGFGLDPSLEGLGFYDFRPKIEYDGLPYQGDLSLHLATSSFSSGSRYSSPSPMTPPGGFPDGLPAPPMRLGRHSRHSSIGSLAGSLEGFNIGTPTDPNMRTDGLPPTDAEYFNNSTFSSSSWSSNRPLKAMPQQSHHGQHHGGLYGSGHPGYVPRAMMQGQGQGQGQQRGYDYGSRPGSRGQPIDLTKGNDENGNGRGGRTPRARSTTVRVGDRDVEMMDLTGE